MQRAANDRNHELYKKAKEDNEKKIEAANAPKVSQSAQVKMQKRYESTVNVVVASVAFFAGFTACKLFLDRMQ